MFSSEQKFNVNGEGKTQLSETLKFAVGWKSSGRRSLPQGVRFDEDTGTVFLYWHSELEGVAPLSEYLTIETFSSIVYDFLKSGEVERNFRVANKPLDIDGSLELGWEVFIPNWSTPGVVHSGYAFLAVKPDWIYYAK